MEFRPSRNESGLRFGLVWSGVGAIAAAMALVGCSYLIPDNDPPPRYNKVIGERHAPPLNAASQAGYANPAAAGYDTGLPPQAPAYAPQGYPQQAPMPQGYPPQQPYPQQPYPQQAPAPQSYNAPSPSYGAPEAQASSAFVTQMPSAAPAPQPRMPAPQPSWFERNFNWLPGVGEDNSQSAPAPASAPVQTAAPAAPFSSGQPETARALAFSQPNAQGSLPPVVPSNLNPQQSYQTVGSSYPVLQDTPPAPVNGAAAQERLAQERAHLQAEQAQANQQRRALQSEVQSQPSLAAEYGYPAPEQSGVPNMPPPPLPRGEAPMVPSFDGTPVPATSLDAKPAQPAAEPEPIVLRPPSSVGAQGEGDAGSPKVINVQGGSHGGYLPESRYARKRAAESGNSN